MRKMVLVLSLISLILASCGTSSGKNTEEKYGEDFDNAMESIEEMRTNADYLMSFNTSLWQDVGPEHIAECINGMVTASEDKDSKIGGGIFLYGYVTGRVISGSMNTWDREIRRACWPTIEKYQSSYNRLLELSTSVKNDVKSIKDNYGEKHSDAAQALQDYYVKAAAYADAATNVSGNLLNYNNSHTAFENQMKELKAAAEFNK